IRSKKNNIICFTDKEGKEHVWERIGSGLPNEYLRMLGNLEIMLPDDNSISPCIGTQTDPHFFISLSDPFKAKILGSISGLDIIDGSLSLIANDFRSNQNLLKNCETRKTEIENDKKVLKEGVEKLNNFYNLINKQNENLINKFNLFNKIFEIKNNLINIKQNIELFNYNIKKYKKIIEALESFSVLTSKAKQLNSVSRLAQGLSSSHKLIVTHGDMVSKQNKQVLALKKACQSLESLINKNNNLNKILNLKYNINKIDYLSYKEKLKSIKEKIVILNEEKNKIFENIKECPLCGCYIKEKK
ncbi:MAG: hypothetical protein WC554_12130, partial [Clostridia bacterium]